MAGSLTTEVSPIGSVSVRQQHILGMDTVRAFAALSVVLAHILGPWLPGILLRVGVSQELAKLSRYIFTGHPAVIVFFVVSGFCIHYPYTRRNLPVIAFTLARWTRIMPPALVAMALAYMLHVEGFNFIDGFILWSIVCELWYYSLYPLFLLLSRRVSFKMQFLVALLISLMLVAYLGSNQYGNAHIYGPGLNWLIALPSWLLGCVLANQLSSEVAPEKYSMRSIILWRASVAIVASVLYWLTLNTPVGYYLTMNLFAIMVFFWIRAEIGAPKNANSLFERIGMWSYSIYLFHMVFLAFISKLSSVHLVFPAFISKLLNVPLINITVILWLCYLAYKVVEKPSHNYARRLFKDNRERFRRVTVAHG